MWIYIYLCMYTYIQYKDIPEDAYIHVCIHTCVYICIHVYV